MNHDQPAKTQNLKMQDLERAEARQELAEEDARQVVGGNSLGLNFIALEERHT